MLLREPCTSGMPAPNSWAKTGAEPNRLATSGGGGSPFRYSFQILESESRLRSRPSTSRGEGGLASRAREVEGRPW